MAFADMLKVVKADAKAAVKADAKAGAKKTAAGAKNKVVKNTEDPLGGTAGEGWATGHYQANMPANYTKPKNTEELLAKYPEKRSAEYEAWDKSNKGLAEKTEAPSQKPIAESSTPENNLAQKTETPTGNKEAVLQEPQKVQNAATNKPVKTNSVGKQLVKGAVTTAAIGGLTAGAIVGIPALLDGIAAGDEPGPLDPNNPGGGTLPWTPGGGGGGTTPYYPGYPGYPGEGGGEGGTYYVGDGGDPGEPGSSSDGGIFSSGTLGEIGEFVADNGLLIAAIAAVIVIIAVSSRPDKKAGNSGKKTGKKPAGKRRASA